jgi:hypothetical protein
MIQEPIQYISIIRVVLWAFVLPKFVWSYASLLPASTSTSGRKNDKELPNDYISILAIYHLANIYTNICT